jgi:hypothetical protein
MNRWRLAATVFAILFPVFGYAANPFLDAKNDQPVSARFRGTEWSDDIGEEDLPLTARVVATRIAKMPWGSIFKIEFTDLKSSALQKREIRTDYFIATDNRIILLNDNDNARAATKISAMDNPPEFEPNDIYGVTSGSFEHQEGEWKTTIKLKGSLCIYEASHSSGHFKKVVWKKGVGLIEYASGYGAHADGYRLKRVTNR